MAAMPVTQVMPQTNGMRNMEVAMVGFSQALW